MKTATENSTTTTAELIYLGASDAVVRRVLRRLVIPSRQDHGRFEHTRGSGTKRDINVSACGFHRFSEPLQNK